MKPAGPSRAPTPDIWQGRDPQGTEMLTGGSHTAWGKSRFTDGSDGK